jgi:CRISPR-associated endonuclease/helicase Cas3
MNLLDDFPAKSNDADLWLSLRNHLKDTAGVMRRLCMNWVPASVAQAAQMDVETFTELAVFCASIHDIGKASMAFLEKRMNVRFALPEAASRLEADGVVFHSCPDAEKTPHNFASATICGMRFGVNWSICEVLASHHGRPRDTDTDFKKQFMGRCIANYYGSEPESRVVFEAAWKEAYDFALAESEIPPALLQREISAQAQMLLTGILIVADWIASNEDYFPLIGDAPYTENRLNDGWSRLGLPGYWESQCSQLDTEAFAVRFGFPPRPAQAEIIRTVEDAYAPGLFIVECQMGAGKTEAALAAAEILADRNGAGGIFFGLPTKGTANGLFPRITDWAKVVSRGGDVTSMRLAHGDAAFNDLFENLRNHISDEDENNSITVNEWLLGPRMQLLSDFVVGTVDHALMAALRTKFVMLRHLGLAGKVVVIDEVHSYDAYMSEFLEYLLRWLGSYGVSVILLSATLTSGKKEDLVNAYLNRHRKDRLPVPYKELYPSLTWTDGADVSAIALSPVADQAMRVVIEREKTDEIADIIQKSVDGEGCVGIIMNTVKAARETAEHLRSVLPEYKVILIHSRFLPADRSRLEDEVLRLCGKGSGSTERRGVIVVGTQVLEQSLDVDFDILFTEWCPMDLLLQRIGRTHRHRSHDHLRPEGASEPRCILCEDDYFPLYDEYLLSRTREELTGRNSLSLPGDIRSLVDSVYDLNCGPASELKEKHLRALTESRKKAEIWRMPDPLWMEMRGLLKQSISAGDAADQEKAVRDISDGVQILLLIRGEYDLMTVDGGVHADMDIVPSWTQAKAILQQRITLPRWMSTAVTIDSIRRGMDVCIPEWLNSKWFEKELILFLDTSGRAVLETGDGPCIITYSRSEGLDWRKGE